MKNLPRVPLGLLGSLGHSGDQPSQGPHGTPGPLQNLGHSGAQPLGFPLHLLIGVKLKEDSFELHSTAE